MHYVSELHLSAKLEMIALALIELGCPFECSYVNCDGDPHVFAERGVWRLTVDHTVSRTNGGSNEPGNLTFMHYRCNMRKARNEDSTGSEYVHLQDEDLRAHHSAFMLNAWQDPEFRNKIMSQAVDTARKAWTTRRARYGASGERACDSTLRSERARAGWEKRRSALR